MNPQTKPTVLLVDDVEIDIRQYYRGLVLTGNYHVETALSVDDAIRKVTSDSISLAVIDLKMPPGSLGDLSTDYGEETGYSLASKLRDASPDIKIIILSHSDEASRLDQAFKSKLGIRDILVKGDTRPIDLVRSLDRIFGLRSMTPTIFIVHGHDRALVEFAQDTVERDLKWARPVVLDEQASGGMTIIEKFEKFASRAEAVLVLMSPDDIGASRTKISEKQFRARQNVLFELGYFYGKFKRQSGRVFVIKAGDLEIPSDLSGVVYINATTRDDELKRVIVKELEHAFRPFEALGSTP